MRPRFRFCLAMQADCKHFKSYSCPYTSRRQHTGRFGRYSAPRLRRWADGGEGVRPWRSKLEAYRLQNYPRTTTCAPLLPPSGAHPRLPCPLPLPPRPFPRLLASPAFPAGQTRATRPQRGKARFVSLSYCNDSCLLDHERRHDARVPASKEAASQPPDTRGRGEAGQHGPLKETSPAPSQPPNT